MQTHLRWHSGIRSTHSAGCISQSGRCAGSCVSGQSCQSKMLKRVCCGLLASPGENKDNWSDKWKYMVIGEQSQCHVMSYLAIFCGIKNQIYSVNIPEDSFYSHACHLKWYQCLSLKTVQLFRVFARYEILGFVIILNCPYLNKSIHTRDGRI